MNGILNLDKPQGITSHDVVAQVRKLTNIKRVGHAGTLDPMATGVLLLCLGRATRVSEYLLAEEKTYQTTLCLGVSTDSHDADGQIVADAPVTVSQTQIEQALNDFRGPILQTPPMFSAIKRQGQPLYKLARQGIIVRREPRPVEIFELTLTAWASPELTLELTCSSGTYVRALARDLGKKLGCGAHLTQLRRLACGDFDASDAINLDKLAQAVATKNWQTHLHPIDAGLRRFAACVLDADDARRVQSGRPVTLAPHTQTTPPFVRAYDKAGVLLALLTYNIDAQHWHPHKVFAPLGQ